MERAGGEGKDGGGDSDKVQDRAADAEETKVCDIM